MNRPFTPKYGARTGTRKRGSLTRFGMTRTGGSADQPAHNLFHYGIGARGDLLWGLVLNWMGNVDCIKVRTPQCSGLDPCRAREFVGGHGDCRDSQILQPDRIVQTARGAGPSIGQAFYYGVGAA